MRRAGLARSIVVAASLLPLAAWSLPIPPKPLWSLTEEAELIVVARVVSTREAPSPHDEDWWDTAVASLRVVESLKGSSATNLEVFYPGSLVCPTPPRYAESETVVAFLERKEGRWRTVSLSYGTLYPQDEELDDVVSMIVAAVALQGAGLSLEDLEMGRKEWHVQATSLPGTRWHGLYELAPVNERFRPFYNRSNRHLRTVPEARHLDLLARAFIDAPKVDTTMPMLLAVLGTHEDPLIDRTALSYVEGLLLLDEPPWWTQDLIVAVLNRWGDHEPEKRWMSSDGSTTDPGPALLRKAWAEAKSSFGIPDEAPARIELGE